jgi:hypothetical protein
MPTESNPPSSSPCGVAAQPLEPAWTRPWKLAGWLVVALLAIVLVVPLLGVLALMISARGRQLDIQEANATNAHLTMTFDEDLPIADIHLDGTSCSPIALSPVERSWPPGKHLVTVVYSHDDRMRSVRETVELAPQEKRTLELTPLVVGDMEERERKARQQDRFLRPD